MNYNKRTRYCGEFRTEHIGESVTVCGWVQRQRDLGGLIFIDLRDRTGLVQLTFGADNPLREAAQDIHTEYVLCASGVVRERSSKNMQIPTGEIEIDVSSLEVLSRSQTPPFEIDDDTRANELLRLEYRYLDLRRPTLHRNLMLRHKITQTVRRFYDSEGFYEIETPILTKSTPEGSRDYLVPSRIHPGKFYALPQSPQQYKQLLMVAGYDRYFQIARCLRDEDLRADRQPDFTQIDMEMSFVGMEDVLDVNERMMRSLYKDVLSIDLPVFPRMTWRESMERFGTDKPDLRFGFELKDITETAKSSAFKVFNEANSVGVINIDGYADRFTRKDIDSLTEFAKGLGVKGLAWHKGESSSFAKFLAPQELSAIESIADFKPGDLLFVVADAKQALVRSTLGALRGECARRLGLLKDNKEYKFLWITEFPMFEWSEEEGRLVAQHHPFTCPMDEDIPMLDTDPAGVRTKAYDMVCNGYELCSGSVRIHDAELQAKIFSILQIPEKSMQARFGHILKAFKYGVPPHGGIGLGLDRIVMLMVGTENIRDVIAFPKTQRAVEVMMNSPDFVETEQLRELSIQHCGVVPDQDGKMHVYKEAEKELYSSVLE